MSIKEAIISRKSQRSYDGTALSKKEEEILYTYLQNKENLVGIHGNSIQIHYIPSLSITGEKIGTYGVIKNAPAYLATVCNNTKEAMIDCGYVFEKLVLFLETKNIGTCWLGGTYKRSQIHVPVNENEIIPIISPIGHPTKKLSFSDKAVRYIAKADSRLAFDTLFHDKDFETSITSETKRELLEYVRLAPSASNKQPWRIVFDKHNVAHFYIERTPNYGVGKLNFDIQMIDIGIALSHYEIAKEKVTYIKKDPKIPFISDYCSYVISVE